MAVSGTKKASSSVTRCSYQALCLSSKDTSTTFTDLLYTELVRVGIRTFRADDEIKRGIHVESEFQQAIKEARISIVVFSIEYAYSEWCLDELLKILHNRKTDGHKVLPIFYKVDPSEVWKQTGSFAKAFANHEEQLAETYESKREWLEKVDRWRAALREVANLRGMVLQNQADGHEAKFIQEIVTVIRQKLNRRTLSIAQCQIGIEAQSDDISSWLKDGASDVGILVISGMGGIGKTTVAKMVYNSNLDRFERSSFLADVRHTSKQPNGLVHLQEQLLSDILKGKKHRICSVDEGIIKIKNCVSSRKILLVLDDVDQMDQLTSVFGVWDWFYPGSKIIITTRYEQLFKSYKVHKTHKVKELNDNHSLELFSWHAFGQGYPIEDFMELSKRIIKHVKGFPLALQLVGSSLRGKSVTEWETALETMKSLSGDEILRTLEISYLSLPDDHDKKLFLHIASFFVQKDKEYVVKILDQCDFYSTVGIENLTDRGLLTIEDGNKLMMHQLLRDMARKIIHQESLDDPGRRSIVCDHSDSFHVLSEKSGTERVSGLIFDLEMLAKGSSSSTSPRVSHLKRLPSQGMADKFLLPFGASSLKRRRLGLISWQSITAALSNLFYTSNEANFETDAFKMMHNLRLLQLNHVQLSGSYREFPKNLRWLCWCGFPLKSMPNNFPFQSLVALDLRYSRLVKIWNGPKILRLLKFLNLSHCYGLITTPDFSGLPNLERLWLKYCTSLVEVNESIGNLDKLVVLNLKGCESLRQLSPKIGQLKSLKKFVLSGCKRLEMMPTEAEEIKPLTIWPKIIWSWLSNPRKKLNLSLAFLPCTLLKLCLRDCNLSDDVIPKDFNGLTLLSELDLSQNPISSITESIRGLTMLKSLSLDACLRLQSLPELPSSLKELSIRDCKSLEKMIISPNLLRSLDVMHLSGCDKLVKVCGLFQLEPIQNFHPEILNSLGFSDLDSEGNIEVELCNNLTLTRKKSRLQGLYEFGIVSTFLPGSKVPAYYRNKSSSMSFIVPSFPNLKVKALNVCVAYECSDAHKDGNLHDFHIMVSNKTKGLQWTYGPTFHGNGDSVWLSHWNVRNLFQAGDEMSLSIVAGIGFKVKGCGSEFVMHKEECAQSNCVMEVIQGEKLCAYQTLMDRDFSVHQRTQGLFCFCHYNLYPDLYSH